MSENAPERDEDAPADATAGAHVEPATDDAPARVVAEAVAGADTDDGTDAAETDDGPEDER
jgi:hypothetical protein